MTAASPMVLLLLLVAVVVGVVLVLVALGRIGGGIELPRRRHRARRSRRSEDLR
ncbi:hypothetical protein V1260_00560 [Brachybacterium sp. J144]|uniref:hypothetical protein n=1 Tax=Brachybacterium sp. J144 TaxID=3116487 RepID=UPI002E76CE17|nr:hypothetical protein [Brachybacterium sp. J144]MEE1649279.1 hypothetical protein [Brachybacterium sp. J144]